MRDFFAHVFLEVRSRGRSQTSTLPYLYDRIQNKVPKNKFGRHGTTRGLQTNKIGTVLCLAQCVIFNIVNGQLCPQSLCGWIGDCPGNERD